MPRYCGMRWNGLIAGDDDRRAPLAHKPVAANTHLVTGPKIRANGDLRGTPHVRVIGSSGDTLGVMTLAEALRAAFKEGLDLVEVTPNADPPVCKISDLGKFKDDARRR